MPTVHSHTHCQAAQANATTQSWQRVCLPLRTTNSITSTFFATSEKFTPIPTCTGVAQSFPSGRSSYNCGVAAARYRHFLKDNITQ